MQTISEAAAYNDSSIKPIDPFSLPGAGKTTLYGNYSNHAQEYVVVAQQELLPLNARSYDSHPCFNCRLRIYSR
jgi:hypothetical protein